MKIIYILFCILLACLAYTFLFPRILRNNTSDSHIDTVTTLAYPNTLNRSEGDLIADLMTCRVSFVPTPKYARNESKRHVVTDTEIRESNRDILLLTSTVWQEIAAEKYDLDGDGFLSDEEMLPMRMRIVDVHKEEYQYDENGTILPEDEKHKREDVDRFALSIIQESLARYDKNHDNVIYGIEYFNMRDGLMKELKGKDIAEEVARLLRQQIHKRKQGELGL